MANNVGQPPTQRDVSLSSGLIIDRSPSPPMMSWNGGTVQLARVPLSCSPPRNRDGSCSETSTLTYCDHGWSSDCVQLTPPLVDRVKKAFGRIDVLVNNAAFQLHAQRIEDISDAHLQETLQTNIAGYFHMARAVLPHMQRGASIVNNGSETGLFGSKHLLDYSATKGAIHAFTKSLASNLLERGIRVNCVAPGPVWTPLNPADKPAQEVAKFGQDSDMGRPAQPEEISPAFVFLASPVTASYINGVILPVMGGPRG